LFTLLSGDGALNALVNGVYDLQVPESAVPSFPYVVVGEANEIADNRHDRLGRRVSVTIHAYSRYRGRKEVTEIMDRINTLVEGKSLAIPGGGWHCVTCFLESAIVLEEDVGQSHGVLRYSVRLEKL
jgi:hypothetical protein